MSRATEQREAVLGSSRSYYANRAYYYDLFAQRKRRDPGTAKELEFLEYAFKTHATRPVRRVLDIACGGGRHIVGLAQRGYDCAGQDLTSDRVGIAKARARRAGVSVRLRQGDATKLRSVSEFDAVLALYIIFLLPSDDDIQKCIRQASRSLRQGGLFVCNAFNPFYTGESGLWPLFRREPRVEEQHAPGIRMSNILRLRDFDPVHGWGWVWETSIIEAPDGPHVFRDRERVRFLTYWDVLHFLESAGFRDVSCHPDWETRPRRKPRAEQLVFTARK